MAHDALSLPIDAAAATALAAQGLRFAVLDPADEAAVTAWIEAEVRGFHGSAPTAEEVAEQRADLPEQRTVGVWDDAIDDAALPVATTTSWPALLTLPGGEVPAWAISDVTVAPTHRRRGIARAVLESELRTAVAGGLPVAALTVSEAVIYRRFGFGPAAWSAALEIDARRAGWLGGDVPGRVQLVDRERALRDGRAVLDRARRATIGDVEVTGHRYDRLFAMPSQADQLRTRRYARYDDADGVPQGILVYRVEDHPTDFTLHTAQVVHLAAATDDAYAALWRFLLELDLVARVRASLRSVDEPLRWLVRDQRAIATTELREHLWVRVLDPVAAFSARSYAGAGRLVLTVEDPLGHAGGAFSIEVADGGRAVVTRGEKSGVPTIDVPVDLLGPLLVGGVSALTLLRAGRIAEGSAGDALAADRLLRSPTAPLLATWF